MIFESFRLALEALRNNKFRSVLTMLGMVIGVFAVVLLVSLAQGAKAFVLREFEGMGTNLIMVQPGKTDRKSSVGPPMGASQRAMTLEDVRALERRAHNLEAVSGLVLGSTSMRYEDALANVSIFGVNSEFPRIIRVVVERGDFFSPEDEEAGRRVVVLGAKVAEQLFPSEYAIGRSVSVNQSEFRVIGILRPAGNKLGFNVDDIALVPTNASLRLFNTDKLFGIRMKASASVAVEDAVEEIREILAERRDGEEDFTIITQMAMMETLGTILNMLSYMLGAIAAISMLVGGIGIMNIMLVSVTERTPEIGIRRAVGARRRDILLQFLGEALTLSVVSGVVGALGAVAVATMVGFIYPDFDMTPPWWILGPAFSMAVVVGGVFGVWPALRAARIEILDALRYE